MKFELDTFGIISVTYIVLNWIYMKIKYKEWTRVGVLAGFSIALLITAIRISGVK